MPTRISAGVFFLLFITMIPLTVKLLIFPYICTIMYFAVIASMFAVL